MAAPTDYVAFYKLENNANDETGNYNGTNNGATFDGKRAYFDGTSAYISIPVFGEKVSFSVSLWYYDDGTSSTYGHMFTSLNSDEFDLKYDVANKKTIFSSASTGDFSTPNNSLPQYEWHHVVMVGCVDYTKIYIDGVEKFTYGAGPELNATSGYRIGLSGSDYTKGGQSHVRVYGYTLTPTQISDIYDEEHDIFYPASVIASASVSINATGIPTREPKATASVSINTSAFPSRTFSEATASISINATASYQMGAVSSVSVTALASFLFGANSSVSVDVSALASADIADREIFTFKYPIQQAHHARFIFAYPIEQDSVSKSITRVNA